MLLTEVGFQLPTSVQVRSTTRAGTNPRALQSDINDKEWSVFAFVGADNETKLTNALASGEDCIVIPHDTILDITATKTLGIGQRLKGMSRFNCGLRAQAAIQMLSINSSSVVEHVKLLGNNLATGGIQTVAAVNKCMVFGCRIEDVNGYGVDFNGTQNSLIQETLVYRTLVAYRFNAAHNNVLLNSDSSNGFTGSDPLTNRSIRLDGSSRNLKIFAGIFERPQTLTPTCLDIGAGSSALLYAPEFQIGAADAASCILATGTVITHGACYGLSGVAAAIDAPGAAIVHYGDIITGSGNQELFEIYKGNVRWGTSGEMPVRTSSFRINTDGWSPTGGGAVSWNATDKRLDCSGANSNQAAINGISSTVAVTGRVLRIRFGIANLTGTPEVNLDINNGAWVNLGKFGNGFFEIMRLAGTGDKLQFRFAPSTSVASTWQLTHWEVRMI